MHRLLEDLSADGASVVVEELLGRYGLVGMVGERQDSFKSGREVTEE